MGEAIITRRGGGILKIAGQTEEIVRFGEAINKYDPVCVKFAGIKLSNPSTLPTGSGNGVAFDSTGTYLAVAHDNSTYITIYSATTGCFKTNLISDVSIAERAGYAKESGVAGENKKIVVIFSDKEV